MKPGLPGVALIAATVLFGVSVAAAQTATPPAAPFAVPPYKNLKILPKDISRADLLNTMKFFTRSLGVRCTNCHVGEEGKPLSTFDFVSDAKKDKVTARKMLAMVHRINEQDFGITEFSKVKVTCFTCHRGAKKPLTDRPLDAAAPPPPAAAPVKSERG
jgi:cytochrome c peroxidase